jgi:hypothetical protein
MRYQVSIAFELDVEVSSDSPDDIRQIARDEATEILINKSHYDLSTWNPQIKNIKEIN